MNRHIELISILLVTASALFSCTERGLEPAVSEEGELVDYGFYLNGTKAGGGSSVSTTYRAMLHTYNTYTTGEYNGTSGTYRATESSEKAWLLPCSVDAYGAWTGDSHAAGLRAMRNKYYISFVSPAVAPQQYTYSSITNWGLRMFRDSSVTCPNLYVSSQVQIDSLKGNRLEGSDVYDFSGESSAVLKVLKSEVMLKIECGSGGHPITVQKAGFLNRIESCWYNLKTGVLENYTLSGSTDTVFVSLPGVPIKLDPDDYVQASQYLTLFSLNYSAKVGGNYVYPVPEVDVLLNTGLVKIQLPDNLQPMKRYICTVTIKSPISTSTVSIEECSIEEWEESENGCNKGLE